MTTIDCVLFDLGKVLVHFDNEHKNARIAAVTGLTAAEVGGLLAQDEWQLRYERGELASASFAKRLLEAAPKPCDQATVLRSFSDIFALNEPMQKIVEALADQGKRLVLVSNTNEAHFDFVRAAWPRLFARFDALVLSHEVGAMKPEPAYYEHAKRAAMVPPERGLFVDDLEGNVAGAKLAGFHGHVFTDVASFVATLRRFGLDRVPQVTD